MTGSHFSADALALQSGFALASGSLAPVAVTGPLLMPPTPRRPVLDCLDRRLLIPHQMPEQPSHLRYGEGQVVTAACAASPSPRDGVLSHDRALVEHR